MFLSASTDSTRAEFCPISSKVSTDCEGSLYETEMYVERNNEKIFYIDISQEELLIGRWRFLAFDKEMKPTGMRNVEISKP